MKKFTKITLVVLLILMTSGCTKNFTDENSKKVYTSNILCKPSTSEIIDVYKENSDKLGVDYDKLSSCSDLKVNFNNKDGLWTNLFVKPLSWLILKSGKLISSYGFAIMILGFLLRLLLFPLSKSSLMMNKNMQKAKPELEKIERKYRDMQDKDSMMMKSQETMLIYKKYNINPLSGCLVSILQIPLFFAFYEAIQRVPIFYEEKIFSLRLGTTFSEGIFKQGNYYYLLILVIVMAVTFFSFKNMSASTGDDNQKNQMKMVTYSMMGFIALVSFSMPLAIGLYWISTSSFAIIQNLLLNKKKTDKVKKVKVVKNGKI